MIRVVLADDQTLVRAGFRSILADETDMEVVGEAADGEQAIALARELRPDVVLMDIRMPVLDGLEATRRILADPRLEGVRVVILTTGADRPPGRPAHGSGPGARGGGLAALGERGTATALGRAAGLAGRTGRAGRPGRRAAPRLRGRGQ